MEAYYCSVFKGNVGLACHIGQGTQLLETVVGGPGNFHNYISVEIILCLVGWAFPLCCKASDDLFENIFRLVPKESIGEDNEGFGCQE